MATVGVHNGSAGRLVLWLEPLGEDRWLRPGETFRIHVSGHGPGSPFEISRGVDRDGVTAGLEYVTVCVTDGRASVEVTDESGAVVECGHQRSAEADHAWMYWQRPDESRALRMRRWLWG